MKRLTANQLWILRQLAAGENYAYSMAKMPGAPKLSTINANLSGALIIRRLIKPLAKLERRHTWAYWVEITKAGREALEESNP